MTLLTETNMKYLNNGKIYKVVCNITGKVYYGSTILSIPQRMNSHEQQYKKYLNKKTTYCSVYSILKNKNYNIYLVEKYGCLNRKQLETIEGFYIKNHKCVNKYICGKTEEEYKNFRKIYEKTDKRQKQNRENVKRYYKENRQKRLQYIKQYKLNNMYKISERSKQKKLCECGANVNIYNINRHKKTKKHLKHIDNN